MAHFLEHMVFMGSEKFPTENGFHKFTNKHGGFCNAHTENEHTTFYFDVHRKNFKEGLDMFAQFFIKPLMLQSAMEREREAVDSEYQRVLPSDIVRMLQIYGTIAKDKHPMGKFMWGNKESLQMGNLSDDHVHRMLHDFKNRHYTAQSMTLVVQSQHTLEMLEDMVIDVFSNVPNNGLPKETFCHLERPFDTPKYHKIYKMSPLQNVYRLDLFWSLPPLMEKFREKPLKYLGFIIEHEGQGSLMAYLREKVWALQLRADNELNAFHSQFSISIILTKAGFDAVDQVLLATFSYLKMLNEQPVNERIFNEIKEIQDLNFKFMEEPQPIDNVEKLCENMQIYPPELIITGAQLFHDLDTKLILDCTKALKPESMCLFMTAREFANETDQVEPWFKANYKVEDIPEEWEKNWKNIEVYKELFLPEPNRFIAKDTNLKQLDPRHISPLPKRLVETNSGELFYKFDTQFKQPRAMINIQVIVPSIRDSLENAVCMDLLIDCLVQEMRTNIYPADVCQLEHQVYITERGFQIKLSGLNDKLSLLLETILGHFAAFHDNFKQDMFEAVKDQLKKYYYNDFTEPEWLMTELKLFMTKDVYRLTNEMHQVISNITGNSAINIFCEFNFGKSS